MSLNRVLFRMCAVCRCAAWRRVHRYGYPVRGGAGESRCPRSSRGEQSRRQDALGHTQGPLAAYHRTALGVRGAGSLCMYILHPK